MDEIGPDVEIKDFPVGDCPLCTAQCTIVKYSHSNVAADFEIACTNCYYRSAKFTAFRIDETDEVYHWHNSIIPSQLATVTRQRDGYLEVLATLLASLEKHFDLNEDEPPIPIEYLPFIGDARKRIAAIQEGK